MGHEGTSQFTILYQVRQLQSKTPSHAGATYLAMHINWPTQPSRFFLLFLQSFSPMTSGWVSCHRCLSRYVFCLVLHDPSQSFYPRVGWVVTHNIFFFFENVASRFYCLGAKSNKNPRFNFQYRQNVLSVSCLIFFNTMLLSDSTQQFPLIAHPVSRALSNPSRPSSHFVSVWIIFTSSVPFQKCFLVLHDSIFTERCVQQSGREFTLPATLPFVVEELSNPSFLRFNRQVRIYN